jgi:hypothetical protein
MAVMTTADVELIFLRVARPDVALLKFLFESYEGVAVVRTLDRHAAVIVVMATRDFGGVAHDILESLRDSVDIEEISPPADLDEEWLLSFVRSQGK